MELKEITIKCKLCDWSERADIALLEGLMEDLGARSSRMQCPNAEDGRHKFK